MPIKLFSLLLPVYSYLFIVCVFALWHSSQSGYSKKSSFTELFTSSKDTTSRFLFLIVLTSMLGTPFTFGFFFKLSIMSSISQNNFMVIIIAICLNLFMLIFYLQISRYTQFFRKKVIVWSSNPSPYSSKVLAVTGAFVLLFAPVFFPALADILYSFF